MLRNCSEFSFLGIYAKVLNIEASEVIYTLVE